MAVPYEDACRHKGFAVHDHVRGNRLILASLDPKLRRNRQSRSYGTIGIWSED
jgi:hypothetical protein